MNAQLVLNFHFEILFSHKGHTLSATTHSLTHTHAWDVHARTHTTHSFTDFSMFPIAHSAISMFCPVRIRSQAVCGCCWPDYHQCSWNSGLISASQNIILAAAAAASLREQIVLSQSHLPCFTFIKKNTFQSARVILSPSPLALSVSGD